MTLQQEEVGGTEHESGSSSEDDNINKQVISSNDSQASSISTLTGRAAASKAGARQSEKGAIGRFRDKCGRIVNSDRVQVWMVFLIAINAAQMGVGTFEVVRNNPDIESIFELVDTIFLSIFTVELGMQFIYYGLRLLLDGWLVFDLIVIVFSWTFASVQIIRAFRIFRALRLITRIKTMKNLVTALFGVMPRMLGIGLLLFLVSYIFAVLTTQVWSELYEIGATEWDYFGGLLESMFTLFQVVTMDDWAGISREVMAEYSWAWIIFVVFIILSGFVVMNLIIAVICDALALLRAEEKIKAMQSPTNSFDGNEGSIGNLSPRSAAATGPDYLQQQQMASLKRQVDELHRTQDQTLLLLQQLTTHIRDHHKADVR